MAKATIKQIKEFFEEGSHGRKCSIQEMKALSPADRNELRELLDEQSS